MLPRSRRIALASASLVAVALVGAGCGGSSDGGSTAATQGATTRAASGPDSCPQVSGAKAVRFIIRNQTQWPIVTRATDWQCTDHGGRFAYSGDGTPRQLDQVRVEPGAEVERTMNWRWNWKVDADRWWLGRFRLGLYQEIGGRLNVIPMGGGPAAEVAMTARSTRSGPVTWGFRPVSEPFVACPIIFDTSLMGGEKARVTFDCPATLDTRDRTTVIIAPR